MQLDMNIPLCRRKPRACVYELFETGMANLFYVYFCTISGAATHPIWDLPICIL